MRVGWKKLSTSLLGLAVCLLGVNAQAQVSEFDQDVATAIDRGLAWFEAQGSFNNPPTNFSSRAPTGLVMLSLLEKRASGDPADPPQGYDGASIADQQKLRNLTAYILNDLDGIPGDLSYRDGAYLMALALYTRTGGPDRGEHADLPGTNWILVLYVVVL